MNATTPPAAEPFAVGLAIETTGKSGSIAVVRAGSVLRQSLLPATPRTASTLAPALAETLQWCQNHDCRPGFIAVASGPGSFTGLRIGVTTAKTLSYALNLPLVAIDSVAAVAATVWAQQTTLPETTSLQQDHGSDEQGHTADEHHSLASAKPNTILIGLNAYRGQVFTGTFRPTGLLQSPASQTATGSQTATEMPTRIVDAQQWQVILSQLASGTAVSGDPAVFRGATQLRFLGRTIADAVGVGLLALPLATAGQWSDPVTLLPRYLRPSAAEEKANASSGTR